MTSPKSTLPSDINSLCLQAPYLNAELLGANTVTATSGLLKMAVISGSASARVLKVDRLAPSRSCQ